MDDLTDGQLRALRNLVDKRGGNLTPFVNIADARHLTAIGFANRSRQGWEITSAGSAYLQHVDTKATRLRRPEPPQFARSRRTQA
jgi:hypothetical protein